MWDRIGQCAGISCSLVISVLESYDIVRRQCRHFKAIVPDNWEVILLDDGSRPPLGIPSDRPRALTLVYTRNFARWTQPIARNLGARLARGKFLFFTDIDHIVSPEAIAAARGFDGSRMLFPRAFAVLDEDGQVRRDPDSLRALGWTDADDDRPERGERVHQNTFAIRREVFLDAMQGGYDESLCAAGRYGGDDVDFNQRYRQLVVAGKVQPDVLGPEIFVYPDPASSTQFHSLSRNESVLP
jgi:hypothetical protein